MQVSGACEKAVLNHRRVGWVSGERNCPWELTLDPPLEEEGVGQVKNRMVQVRGSSMYVQRP
jgi:hypothetical protein